MAECKRIHSVKTAYTLCCLYICKPECIFKLNWNAHSQDLWKKQDTPCISYRYNFGLYFKIKNAFFFQKLSIVFLCSRLCRCAYVQICLAIMASRQFSFCASGLWAGTPLHMKHLPLQAAVFRGTVVVQVTYMEVCSLEEHRVEAPTECKLSFEGQLR